MGPHIRCYLPTGLQPTSMPQLVSGQQQYFQAPARYILLLAPLRTQITASRFSLHLRGCFLQVHCLQEGGWERKGTHSILNMDAR